MSFPDDNKISTLKDLYSYLIQNINPENFLKWLRQNWDGKEKMESCFALFSSFNIFPFQKGYTVCKGKLNKGDLQPCNNVEKLLLEKVKTKGDASDRSFKSNTEDSWIFTTSKNNKKLHVNQLDISHIGYHFAKNKFAGNYRLCICIPSRKKLYEALRKAESSSKELVKDISKPETIIIDYQDLQQAYYLFYKNYSDYIPKENPKPLLPYFHQLFLFRKLCEILSSSNKAICNAIPRSGKTIIMGLCIQFYKIITKKVRNILVITLRPSENIESYRELSKEYDFPEANFIFPKDHSFNKPRVDKNNVVVVSKQFLQSKTGLKKIKWLSTLDIGLLLIDEPHDGGSTEKATEVYETYGGKDCKIIYFTATCNKPAIVYRVPSRNIATWDMSDVNNCRYIDQEEKRLSLIKKHGLLAQKTLAEFSDDNIKHTYSKYPKLIFYNNKFLPETKDIILESGKGWSINALFCRDGNNTFMKEDQVVKFFRSIFGNIQTRQKVVIPDKTSLLAKWNVLKRENKSSVSPHIIMMFVNPLEIVSLGKAITALFHTYKIAEDYHIVALNTKENTVEGENDSLIRIYKNFAKAKNMGKKGLIVISGKMLAVGSTIPECDTVAMLSDIHSWDLFYQSSFRCMTEMPEKTVGIVYDFNNRRQLSFIGKLSESCYGKSDPETIRKLLDENIVELHGDFIKDHFQTQNPLTQEIANYIHEIYMTDIGTTKQLVESLSIKAKVSQKFCREFNSYFAYTKSGKKKQDYKDEHAEEIINNTFGGDDTDIPDGLERTRSESKSKSEKDDTKIDIDMFQKVFPYIVQYLIILTLDSSESLFTSMCKTVMSDKIRYAIILQQLRSCWGEKVPENTLEEFSKAYEKELSANNELEADIRYLKERFRTTWKKDMRAFYELVEESLIPHESERRNNAEISTPSQLRTEMLDALPKKLWEKKVRVFEPCCGKGGFLIDIFTRFAKGLEISFPDENKRRKFILEKLLYFADINPFNTYICRKLLDPEGKYRLNCYTGDTLDLDIKEVFGVEKFTLIIGNPPYSTDPSKPSSKPLYNLFIEKYIDLSSYFMFVIPSRWFSGGKGLDKFRKNMLSRKDIKLMRHQPDCKKWFPSVNIEGGLSYFLKNSSYKGNCDFNGIPIDLNRYDILVEPRYINVLEKLRNFETIGTIYMTGSFYKVRPNDKRLTDNSTFTNIPCLVSFLKKSDRIRYIDKKHIKRDDYTWKVATARANGKKKCFGFSCVSEPEQIYTDSYIAFRTESKEEAESLLSYLRCRLPNYVLGIRKISQDISTDTVKWIPMVPLNRTWSDEKVFEYFGIKEEELL